jgi:hypothetical protein
VNGEGAARGGWGGWVLFASVIMIVMGFSNLFQGLAALLSDKYYLITEKSLLVFDFTTWGWILLIWGVVLMIAGVSLGSRKEWSRWFALVVIVLNVIAQFGFLAAFPLWTILIIALEIVVLFTLTARWQEAKAES